MLQRAAVADNGCKVVLTAESWEIVGAWPRPCTRSLWWEDSAQLTKSTCLCPHYTALGENNVWTHSMRLVMTCNPESYPTALTKPKDQDSKTGQHHLSIPTPTAERTWDWRTQPIRSVVTFRGVDALNSAGQIPKHPQLEREFTSRCSLLQVVYRLI